MNTYSHTDITNAVAEYYYMNSGNKKIMHSLYVYLKRLSERYPVQGSLSLASRFAECGYYTDDDLKSFIKQSKPYCSRRSTKRSIREGNDYRDISDSKNESSERNSSLALKEELEKEFNDYHYLEKLVLDFDNMYSLFIYEHGKEPEAKDEFYAFEDDFCKKYEIEYYSTSGDSDSINSYYCNNVASVSDEIIDLLNSDYRYEPILLFPDPGSDEAPVIIGVKRRLNNQEKKQLLSKKREFIFDALFDIFFEPINEDALLNDLFVVSNKNVEFQKTALYGQTKVKLRDYSNYCSRRISPIEEGLDYEFFNDIKDNIISELKAYINKEWGSSD